MPGRLGAKDKYPRRPWTKPEEARLVALWRAGVSVEDIGADLHRGFDSVWLRAKQLGISGKRRPAWTRGQKAIVDREVDAMIVRLSQRLGRSDGALAAQIARSVMRWPKRKRAAKIADVGGMRAA